VKLFLVTDIKLIHLKHIQMANVGNKEPDPTINLILAPLGNVSATGDNTEYLLTNWAPAENPTTSTLPFS
jgi:hypothetical protein